MRYQVTWGADSAFVQAADENEAWSKFCDGNSLAKRAPGLHERKVLEVTAEPQRVLLVEAAEPEVDDYVVLDVVETEEVDND